MTKENLSLVHELLEPRQAQQKPPLLLMLHGFGSHEQDLFSMAPMLNERCLIVSARAPHSLSWGGFAWYEINFDNRGGKMSNTEQAAESRDVILKFVDEIHKAYGTDPEQTHLMGFSQGCILSYALALNYPTRFQKIIALSGYILKDIVPEQYKSSELSHLDVFASHGNMDDVLPVDWARNSMQVLEKLKIAHHYREYPVGHGLNQENFEDLKSWMKERGLL